VESKKSATNQRPKNQQKISADFCQQISKISRNQQKSAEISKHQLS
jgi:hypothetical protein